MDEKFLNKIIKGDNVKAMQKMPDNSVDLIFADPPYFMQTSGILNRIDGTEFDGVKDAWDKFVDLDDYEKFTYTWLKECKRVLKKDGSIWVIGSFQNIYQVGYIMQKLGFWILNDVIWSKPNAVPNFMGTRFQNSHETLIWAAKSKNSKVTFNYKTMKELNGGRQEKSVWDISIVQGNERLKDKSGKKIHSTQKPEALLEKVILSSSKPGDIILDPFFGTGTTGAIAKKYKRNYIGLEREDKYIRASKKRIKNQKVDFNEYANLSLEVKPPKVPMEKLIAEDFIKDGEWLYDAKGNKKAKVLPNGWVSDGKESLSIHKMSAKELNKESNNGWSYFYVKRGKDFKSIDELRYEYSRIKKQD